MYANKHTSPPLRIIRHQFATEIYTDMLAFKDSPWGDVAQGELTFELSLTMDVTQRWTELGKLDSFGWLGILGFVVQKYSQARAVSNKDQT